LYEVLPPSSGIDESIRELDSKEINTADQSARDAGAHRRVSVDHSMVR
jgi:hypothetical protein